MKRKRLSLALALALCLGLTVPALALEVTPGVKILSHRDTLYSINVEDPSGKAQDLGGQAFSLRNWTRTDTGKPSDPGNPDSENLFLWEKGQPETLSPDHVFTLPAGSEIVMKSSDNWMPDGEVYCRAWSDPDGDGVYDRRVCDIVEYGVLPAGEAGPLNDVYDTDGVEDRYTYKDFWEVNCAGGIYYWTMGYGGGWEGPDAKITVTADSLKEQFGPNTLFSLDFLPQYDEEGRLTGISDSFYFLLTDDTPAEPEQPEPTAFPFTDVAENSPYRDAILWAVEQGITNGTSGTTFSPSNTCTVRQILTFLYRAAGKPGAVEGQNDLDAAVAWATAEGILADGIDSTAACTRSMAVEFMWKAAGSPAPSKSATFDDVSADAAYADAVAWAVEKGVTNGTGGNNFSPDSTCTRGQIVTFLYRSK